MVKFYYHEEKGKGYEMVGAKLLPDGICGSVRRIIIALCAFALLFCSCGTPAAAPAPAPEDTAPVTSGAEAKEEVRYVPALAKEVFDSLGVQPGGEDAVREIYRHLVTRVYFSDPVGLDAWRYFSDENEAIPYLENRALSPLLFQIGSCEDFAAAAVMLLRAAGLQAEYVAGYTLSVDQVYIDHAWAVVCLNGVWYHLDPQLEQNVVRGNTMTYRFYLKSDDDFYIDHKWGENLIAFWPEMPAAEKVAIRRDYTPPACPQTWDSPPQPHAVALPPTPNIAEVEAKLREFAQVSGKTELAPLYLNVEPPVLVARHHITPPLQAAEPSGFFYGRSFLQGDEAVLYDRLAAAAQAGRDGAEIVVPSAVPPERAQAIAAAFFGDHPEYYYIAFDLSDGSGVTTFRCRLLVSPDALAAQQAELEAYAAPILTKAAALSPFEAALLIHDTLAVIPYDQGAAHAGSENIYGTMIGGTAMCDGYAKSFQYLAARAGLDVIYVQGRNLRGVPHAWNAVRLEGGWYFVDVTWDRPLKAEDGVYHDYFLISTQEMLRDRFWEETQYPRLPETAARPQDYYRRMGYAVSGSPQENAVSELAELFSAQLAAKPELTGGARAQFLEMKVAGSREEYEQWKNVFVKEFFSVLRQMDSLSERDNLPFLITDLESAQCDFNDKMQVITFYPAAKQK